MKSKRQEKILELIADHSVQTQEQLLAELNEAGFSTTQATISRDIKQLRIIKELGPNGVYRYATAPKPAEHTFSAKLNLIFRQCITSVDYAQNMIVIKTMPGLANGANYTGHRLRSVMPMLDPRRVAQAIVALAYSSNPKPVTWLGASALPSRVANAVSPSLYGRARRWFGERSMGQSMPMSDGNLYEPSADASIDGGIRTARA